MKVLGKACSDLSQLRMILALVCALDDASGGLLDRGRWPSIIILGTILCAHIFSHPVFMEGPHHLFVLQHFSISYAENSSSTCSKNN